MKCVLASLMLLGCGGLAVPPKASQVSSVGASETPNRIKRLPLNVVPTNYELELELRPQEAGYRGRVSIRVKLSESVDTFWLHSSNHQVAEAYITPKDGDKMVAGTIRTGASTVAISASSRLAPGFYTIDLLFSGEMKTPLMGMYRVEHAGDWYIYTQFEPLGARLAFPCFDEPRFKTPFKISIITQKGVRAFSNAPVGSETVLDGERVKRDFLETPPMPTYLVALAVGPIDVASNEMSHLTREDGTTLPIRILTPRGRRDDARSALAHAAEVVASQEAYFGTRYPYRKLDLVAVPDFGAGAMENAGLVTYRDSLLLFDKAKAPESSFRRYLSIHAHEIAHMWFGNLVTMKWWDDLWLNEAFATWFAAKTVMDLRPDWQTRFRRLDGVSSVMSSDSKSETRRIREPIRTEGDVRDAFDGITYTKGAAVLDMFESHVGAEVFRAAVRKYLDKARWKNATYNDLLGEVGRESGDAGIIESMSTYLDQPGVPLLTFDVGACAGGKSSIKLSQKRWAPVGGRPLSGGVWHVPYCIKSLPEDALHCGILKTQQEAINVSGCGPFLPNATARGYYVWKVAGQDEKAFQVEMSKADSLVQTAVSLNMAKLLASTDVSVASIHSQAQRLLGQSEPRLVLSGLKTLVAIGGLVDDSQRERWRRHLAKVTAHLFDKYGPNASDAKTKVQLDIRRRILTLHGNAGDVRVLKWAAGEVDAFLSGAKFDAEAISVAMWVFGRMKGDEASFKRFEGTLHQRTDAFERAQVLVALRNHRYPGSVQRLMGLFKDDRIKHNERSGVLWGPARDMKTRDEAWSWVRNHLDLIQKRLGKRRMSWLPYYAASHCNESAAKETEALFKDSGIEGLERHLANALDTFGQCTAKRSHYALDVEKLLSKSDVR